MMDLQTVISTYLTSNLMLLLMQISVVTYLQSNVSFEAFSVV